MAKRKDRVGMDFNKLVLAILLHPLLFYHVIQNLLDIIPYLFFSIMVWRWVVVDGARGKKVFLPCLGNIIFA